MLMLIGIVTYLFSNNDLEYSDFHDTYAFLKEGIIQLVVDKRELRIETEISPIENSTGILLNRGLKHLEFILELESYMESNENTLLSSKFLEEFKTSKFDTQLSVLKSTQILSDSNKIAA
jgi:hypothetical protein